MTYNVVARRWDRGWELHIDGVGVTQSRRLGPEAERMVRDYIELDRGAKAARGAQINFTYDVGPLTRDVDEAARAATEAEAAKNRAGKMKRRMLAKMVASGITRAEAARMLEISPQRVTQLLKDNRARSEAVSKKARGVVVRTTRKDSGAVVRKGAPASGVRSKTKAS